MPQRFTLVVLWLLFAASFAGASQSPRRLEPTAVVDERNDSTKRSRFLFRGLVTSKERKREGGKRSLEKVDRESKKKTENDEADETKKVESETKKVRKPFLKKRGLSMKDGEGTEDSDRNHKNTTTTEQEAPTTNSTKPTQSEPPPPFVLPQQSMLLGPTNQGGKQMPQQRPPAMIILGDQGRTNPGRPIGAPPPHAPSTTAILASALATVLTTYFRIWLLTSLTRWFSDVDIKSLRPPRQRFVWERLNDRYKEDTEALSTALETPPVGIPVRQWRKHVQRLKRLERQKHGVMDSPKQQLDGVFTRSVVVFDLKASNTGSIDLPHLEEVVSFVLHEYRRDAFGSAEGSRKELEVVVLLESPGGGVQDYGLAAAQIERLTREPGIVTTVCVDKFAASGGYMIASQATKVIAAPFAVVGSIGVIRESLHFHETLGKLGIESLTLKSGEAKNPLTRFGKISKGDVQLAQATVDKFHKAFRQLVSQGRPVLEGVAESVYEGETYFGKEARDLNLIDATMTSGEYIMSRIDDGDRVLKLQRAPIPSRHNRRLINDLNLLDFVKEQGLILFRKQDWTKLVPALIQTSGIVGFVQYFVRAKFL